MAENKKDKLFKDKVAYHIVRMLEGIPEDLVDIFTPEGEDELAQFEINILKWLARVQERQKIMQLQKRHDLPLRPNQSLRDVTIYIKILELKKRRQDPSDDSGDNYPLI